jgi:hypothetical protein
VHSGSFELPFLVPPAGLAINFLVLSRCEIFLKITKADRETLKWLDRTSVLLDDKPWPETGMTVSVVFGE